MFSVDSVTNGVAMFCNSSQCTAVDICCSFMWDLNSVYFIAEGRQTFWSPEKGGGFCRRSSCKVSFVPVPLCVTKTEEMYWRRT
jgi:hypothetical protein